MFQTKVVEKIKTHILCSVTFFFLENRAVYEKMWKNMVVRQATVDNIVRRMPIACWIPKDTDTNSEYVILIVFPLQQYLHECSSVLHVLSVLFCLNRSAWS